MLLVSPLPVNQVFWFIMVLNVKYANTFYKDSKNVLVDFNVVEKPETIIVLMSLQQLLYISHNIVQNTVLFLKRNFLALSSFNQMFLFRKV